MIMKDYYEIMGLSPDATGEEIRRGYRKLAMQYHPDRNMGDPQCEERLKELNEAYQTLSVEERRTRYDLLRRWNSRESPPYRVVRDSHFEHDLWALFHPGVDGQRISPCKRRGFGKRGCRRWIWDAE
jgi:curved DNA-binding protein CbpA